MLLHDEDNTGLADTTFCRQPACAFLVGTFSVTASTMVDVPLSVDVHGCSHLSQQHFLSSEIPQSI